MKVIKIELSWPLISMLLVITIWANAIRPSAAAETRQDTLASPVKTINEDTQEPGDKPDKTDHSKHRMPSKPDGVISLDIVEKNNKIYLLLGLHEKGEQSVVLKTSRDGGKTWSAPVTVDTGQTLAPNLIRSNDARLTVSGDHLLAFWTSYKEGAMHSAGPMIVARSVDGGQTWQPGNSPTDWNKGAHAFFATDGDRQQLHLVWLDSRHGPVKVKGAQGMRHAYSTDGGLSWSSTITLDGATCACCWTSARLHEDKLYVLYRDKLPSDMSFGMIHGQAWQRMGTVGEFNWFFEGCPHIGGAMAFGQSKHGSHIHTVVGTGHPERSGIYYLQSTDGGKQWSSPVRMGDDSGLHGDVAVNEHGRLVVVWDGLAENGLAIFAAEQRKDGTFSDPVKVSSPDVRAAFPRVVPAGEKFLIVWTQSKDGKREELEMQHF
ncbi:MAG: sialidase family protein [Nitrosomonas sp.]